MRRVVLEVPEQDIKDLGSYQTELSRGVESLRVVHHLRHGTRDSAVVCKIKPKKGTGLRALRFSFKKFEVLSEEEDGLIVFVEAEATRLPRTGGKSPVVYLNFPFEVRNGVSRLIVVGQAQELKKLFRWFKSRSVRFRILSNSDARSSPSTPLEGLTPQQRAAILSAFINGYYQTPRRVNIKTLAGKQGVNKSTFAEHLLKAENKLISESLEGEVYRPDPWSNPERDGVGVGY